MLSFRSLLALLTIPILCFFGQIAEAELRVGAAKIDISPTQLPVWVNGGFLPNRANTITTRIHARAIVLDDGKERIGICVVDSCILARQLCDEAKTLAASSGELSEDRILISATHTHTAPSSYGALGTDPDPTYVPLLRQKIAEALLSAEKRLQPAKVGWGSARADNFTALRRWILRPDRVRNDPFGNPTVRATMHAAKNLDDVTGPTGPEDPELSLIAFQTLSGEPIAVLSNFSMHYFGGQKAISADYFGLYCQQLEEFLSNEKDSDVVAVMSHGCSGDIWKKDYMQPRAETDGSVEQYTVGLLEIARKAYEAIDYAPDADLAMAQAELRLKYRVPDAQRLHWAEQIVEGMGDRAPKNQLEVYAREQVILHQRQSTELVLQAIRIGDIAITTTANETYALTGLKLKSQSPRAKTMVIELANGGEGYIPPPEQHHLGGYNTWAARSAGLEERAEPQIVATDLKLLEEVTGEPRRIYEDEPGKEAARLLDLHPVAYWRMNEFAPPVARDVSSHGLSAYYEPGVVFFLDGPNGSFSASAQNRCAHFAGGRMQFDCGALGDSKTILMSIWNGMPLGVRDVTGWFLSNDQDGATSASGLHLGLNRAGKLLLQVGHKAPVAGKQVIPRWKWARVALRVSDGEASVFLAGESSPEITIPIGQARLPATWFFGGRADNRDNWEGRLDEIAVFSRALAADELFGK